MTYKWLLLMYGSVALAMAATSLVPKRKTFGSGKDKITVTTFASEPYPYLEECEEMQLPSRPDGPWIPCSFLPDEFVLCDPPVLANPSQNGTKDGDCPRFGGVRYEDVARTNVSCKVLACVECYGPRTFLREVPCIKYTGHYFLSTLLYSIFLGVLAVDRFCLGYSAIAVGKLMTLGGLGVWWIIDICLLVTGNLMPADDSNWEPYY